MTFNVGDHVEYVSTGGAIQPGATARIVNIDRDGQYQIVMDNPGPEEELSTRGWCPHPFHWTVIGSALRLAPEQEKLEFTDEEIVLLVNALNKKIWSLTHVGMADTNPRKAALLALREKVWQERQRRMPGSE